MFVLRNLLEIFFFFYRDEENMSYITVKRKKNFKVEEISINY